MAKVKRGLGRGLESLLGSNMEEGLVSGESTMKEDSSTGKTASRAKKEESGKSGSKESGISQDSGNVTGGNEVASTGMEVDINLVVPNPDQPRTSFKEEDLAELASSIKKNGLLQPILVRKVDDHYQIIAGERRWQACKSIGMEKVPVVMKEADDDETVVLALIENIQRSNLNPIEEAYGYKRMMEQGNMTQAEVAEALSKGRTTITNALRLLELPDEAQKLLFEEKITAGHARAILSIPTQEGRRKLTNKIMDEQLSVRDAERIARLLSGKTSRKSGEQAKAARSYRSVARALSDTLATDVKIKTSQGKNRIEMTFKDEADLERLFKLITNER